MSAPYEMDLESVMLDLKSTWLRGPRFELRELAPDLSSVAPMKAAASRRTPKAAARPKAFSQ
jgi:hypothetical protein